MTPINQFEKTFAEILALIQSDKKVAQFVLDNCVYKVTYLSSDLIRFYTTYLAENENKAYARAYEMHADETVTSREFEISADTNAEWGNITGSIDKQADLIYALQQKQNLTDNMLLTDDKSVVGAINELYNRPAGAQWGEITGYIADQSDLQEVLEDKQFRNDAGLTTDDKSVVGAINEINEKAGGGNPFILKIGDDQNIPPVNPVFKGESQLVFLLPYGVAEGGNININNISISGVVAVYNSVGASVFLLNKNTGEYSIMEEINLITDNEVNPAYLQSLEVNTNFKYIMLVLNFNSDSFYIQPYSEMVNVDPRVISNMSIFNAHISIT